jgi:hypothetical protein
MKTSQSPFADSDAILATVARLFAVDGDLLAVEVLSSGKARFEWYTHDNWDGGFDVYNLYLEVPLPLFSKAEKQKSQLEQKLQDRIQAVSQGHTSDHIRSVSIILEVTAGGNWRDKAKAWVQGGAIPLENERRSERSNGLQICPEVFATPRKALDENQVAVMMPFSKEFDLIYLALKRACKTIGLGAVRADDIWENNTFVQDIFELIYSSKVVIVDFTGRNPNVMYETGIAHTLGRQVLPITQQVSDVPSDLKHHRALVYLPNAEGLTSLERGVILRLGTITGREPTPNA